MLLINGSNSSSSAIVGREEKDRVMKKLLAVNFAINGGDPYEWIVVNGTYAIITVRLSDILRFEEETSS
jgi:hypothetical protein